MEQRGTWIRRGFVFEIMAERCKVMAGRGKGYVLVTENKGWTQQLDDER
jgi:hypothetical protein